MADKILVGVIGLLIFMIGVVTATDSSDNLRCPDDIKTFSMAPNNRSYYECTGAGERPKVKRCPMGETYRAYRETCGGDNEANVKTYNEAVLGRDVLLGDMYNSRTDELLTGYSFWKSETITKVKIRRESHRSTVKSFYATSTLQRLDHSRMTAELKLGILDGAVPVDGSSAFLKDTIDTTKTIAVALKYSAETRLETLPILTNKDNNICKSKEPTHVITSIRYGIDSNFLFTKSLKDGELMEEKSKELREAIMSIPSIKVGKDSKVNISDALKEIVGDVHVKFFSDFVPDEPPTTFVDSVRTYHTLLSRVRKSPDYSNSVPLELHLVPITRFCDNKEVTSIGISDKFIISISKMLQQIESTRIKANTLSMEKCVSKYSPLKEILSTFSIELNLFEAALKGELQKVIPDIRSGASSEARLVEILTKYTRSPFHHNTAHAFLKRRSREINVMEYILNPHEFSNTSIKILDYEDGDDDKILFKKTFVLMLKFNIIPSHGLVERFLQGNEVDESKAWYNTPEVVASMGEQFRYFAKFANANANSDSRGYLMAISDVKKFVINVYAQRKGKILSEFFTFPLVPEKMNAIANTYNSITFTVKKTNNSFIDRFIINHWMVGKEERTAIKTYKFVDEDETYAVVDDLLPNQSYQFSLKYVTSMGVSTSGPSSFPITTRPSSAPTNLRIANVTSSSFEVSWDAPVHQGVNITTYKVIVTGVDFYVIKFVHGARHTVFERLDAASTYNISIQATADPRKRQFSERQVGRCESRPSSILALTSPPAPSTPTLLDISIHSANLKWSSPSKIARGALVRDYLVRYVTLNNLGNATVLGSTMVQSSSNETSATLNGLTQGTTYGVSVKVVTSLGSSAYSAPLIIKTKFNETELEKLRHTVEKEIKNISEESRKIQGKIQVVKGEMRNRTAMNEVAIQIERHQRQEVQNRTEMVIQSEIEKRQEQTERLETEVQNKTKLLEEKTNLVFFYPLETTDHFAYYLYPQFHANFVGLGWYKSSDTYERPHLSSRTVENCIKACYGKWSSDKMWNGVGIMWKHTDINYCYCVKNMKGLDTSGSLPSWYITYQFL